MDGRQTMKLRYIVIILIVFAWPLNYLYQLQLGAISFLLLAIFFLVVTIKEVKKIKRQKEKEKEQTNKEKIKAN
jgi:membrane protein implicated in regulation of membrane protease activity